MLELKLIVVGGDTDSREFTLHLPAVIGRGRDADLNLTHPLVSRRHCELLECEGFVLVRDLESMNGTFVGSEKVLESPLAPGELLTVGTVTFRAQYDATTAARLRYDGAHRNAADTLREWETIDLPTGGRRSAGRRALGPAAAPNEENLASTVADPADVVVPEGPSSTGEASIASPTADTAKSPLTPAVEAKRTDGTPLNSSDSAALPRARRPK